MLQNHPLILGDGFVKPRKGLFCCLFLSNSVGLSQRQGCIANVNYQFLPLLLVMCRILPLCDILRHTLSLLALLFFGVLKKREVCSYKSNSYTYQKHH